MKNDGKSALILHRILQFSSFYHIRKCEWNGKNLKLSEIMIRYVNLYA